MPCQQPAALANGCAGRGPGPRLSFPCCRGRRWSCLAGQQQRRSSQSRRTTAGAAEAQVTQLFLCFVGRLGENAADGGGGGALCCGAVWGAQRHQGGHVWEVGSLCCAQAWQSDRQDEDHKQLSGRSGSYFKSRNSNFLAGNNPMRPRWWPLLKIALLVGATLGLQTGVSDHRRGWRSTAQVYCKNSFDYELHLGFDRLY